MKDSQNLEITAYSEEQVDVINRATDIFFKKKDCDIGVWLPVFAEQNTECPLLQIYVLAMHFFSFSRQKMDANFEKYMHRLNQLYLSNKLNERERLYVGLMKQIQRAKWIEACAYVSEIALLYPLDRFSIILLEALAFISGKMECLSKVYEFLMEMEEYKNSPDFIGMLSFLYCHQNKEKEALSLVEKCLSIEPGNAWIQHVYAHALESMDIEKYPAKLSLFTDHSADWVKQSRFFESHNWVHSILFSMKSSTSTELLIAENYLKHVWGLRKQCRLEQNNAFLVLWNAELNDIKIPRAWWEDLAESSKEFSMDYFTPYLTVTTILTIAKAEYNEAEKAVYALKKYVLSLEKTSKYHAVWQNIAIPVLTGCLLYIRGEYAQAEKELSSVYDKTESMGHSNEQRSIFYKTYFKALER